MAQNCEAILCGDNFSAYQPIRPHAPIRINGPADFVVGQNGVTGGSGTESDPYRIENWYIDATGSGNAIYIGNITTYATNTYFVVQNCVLQNAKYLAEPYFCGAGITLSNVEGGTVRWNTVSNNTYGICMQLYTSISTISNNTVHSNTNDGLWLLQANGNTIQDNYIYSNDQNGIRQSSSNCNTISNNVLYANKRHGLWMVSSNTNTLSYNRIVENREYALYLTGSSDNIIHHNDFIRNNADGVQGYDDDKNHWNDTKGQGNYWSDYTTRYPSATNNGIVWNTPYMIDGNRDNHPLVGPVSNAGTPALLVTMNVSPDTLYPGQKAAVTVHISDGINPISDVAVELTSSGGGTFNPQNGVTDSGGNFTSEFTAPSVNIQTICRLATMAAKSGYKGGSGNATIIVNLPKPNSQPTAIIDSISPNPAVYGEVVTFLGHGTDTDGIIVEYSWNSSIDGVLNKSSSFSTSNLSIGKHTIYFCVRDNNGTWSPETTAILDIYPPQTNRPPKAIIDSITPSPAVQGEEVTFVGHGTDPDGTVIAYSWRSSLDGNLSAQARFSTSSLSIGTHKIYFSVMDNNHTWSPPVTANLAVEPVFAISGHVYRLNTTEALSGATLKLEGKVKRTTTTDVSGRYFFAALVNGTYTITVSKEGYQNISITVTVSGADVTKDIYLAPIPVQPPENNKIPCFETFSLLICFCVVEIMFGLIVLTRP